jgi:hypothetical protein
MFDARPNLDTAGWLRPTEQHTVGSILKENFNMDRLKEYKEERMKKMRPWMGEFFNREQFATPEAYATAQNRLVNNLSYFQSNYMVVGLVLFLYCV